MNSKVVSINLYAIFMLFLVVFLRETEVSTACNLSSVITSCLPSLHGIFTKPAGVKECCPILWKENLDYCLCDDLKSLKMAGIKVDGIKNLTNICPLPSFDYTRCS
ncbi:hypothetical protein OROGR_018178 [Orobanche gracilis]